MTSKEFKEKIENSPTILNRHMLLVDDDVLSIIKDLEVLEIFKDQLHIGVYIGYFNNKPMYILKIAGCDIFIPKEMYNKLKEWLENE